MCEYCDLLSGDMNPLTKEMCLTIERHNNTYTLVADNIQDDIDEIDINYCPMCGRDLRRNNIDE